MVAAWLIPSPVGKTSNRDKETQLLGRKEKQHLVRWVLWAKLPMVGQNLPMVSLRQPKER